MTPDQIIHGLTVVIGYVIAYTILREMLFYYTVHKLINKLMSRNYWEYARVNNPTVFEQKERLGEDQTPYFEDLNHVL